MQCLCLGSLSLEQFVVDRAHDGRVADGTVVDKNSINGSNGVQQTSIFYLLDDNVVFVTVVGGFHAVIEHLGVVPEPSLYLSSHYCCDLLRRP